MTDDDKTHLQQDNKTVATGFNPNRPTATVAPHGQSPVVHSVGKDSALAMDAEKTRMTTGPGVVTPAPANPVAQPTSYPTQLITPSGQTASLAVGDVLKGRFEIVEALGEGGMGMVFKAIDARKLEAKSRNPYVAIKVLSPALAQNAVLIAGLQRECEKAQELSHPNIITVYDFDRDGDFVFMSMEYLAGQPLSKIIRQSAVSGGLKLERAWPIIRKMGEALVYAHKKHIVHSDFKPANVFVTDNDDVKVLDFGIASRLGQTEADETIFDARAEGGLTPPYASFEMLNGSRADPRDDIYAFGLVVYELLSGKHPYDRKPASKVFLEQRSGQQAMPKPVAGLNRKQWQLLKSAIEILQEQRPMRLDEWLELFEPNNQPKWAYGVTGGLLLLLLGGGGFYYLQSQSRPDRPVEAQSPPVAPAEVARPQVENPVIPAEPPLANAGDNLNAIVGQTVVLNGGQSRSRDGGPLKYAWRIITRPADSKAALTDADSATPRFIPDQAGNYTAELSVTDTGNQLSQPVTVSINVDQAMPSAPEIEAVLHESTSRDGVLYLAASKPKYLIGDQLALNFRVAKAGYLRVAYLSSMGEISELLPNKYQPGKVKPGVEYRIPPKAQSFKLQVTGPAGIDRIVAVFSESPIAKVKNIATAEGTLVNELQDLAASSVMVQYDVLNKQ